MRKYNSNTMLRVRDQSKILLIWWALSCLMIKSDMKTIVVCVFLLAVISKPEYKTCEDISTVKIHELIGFGAVKAVYRGVWRNMNTSVSILRDMRYYDDFHHGIKMLKKHTSNPQVVRLFGSCEKMMLTEWYPLGDARSHPQLDVVLALKLCLSYASILDTLHSRNPKTVNCDSNDLNKTLSQLLIGKDFTLVLNDVDSLAEMWNGKPIRCGSRKMTGSFVAPEQIQRDAYDEKTDIWKAVMVCEHFMKQMPPTTRYGLVGIHRQCKETDPILRPTSKQLMHEYTTVLHDYL